MHEGAGVAVVEWVGGKAACVCACACMQVYRMCVVEALLYGFPLHLQRICGGVGECVCEKCRCQEGYEGEHCESCDISVIEVSPTHPVTPFHQPLRASPPCL